MIALKALWMIKPVRYATIAVATLVVVSVAKMGYDAHKKKEVLRDVVNQEETIKSEGRERVQQSDRALDGVPDCTLLSRVYQSDQCTRGPHLPETDLPETPAPESTDFDRTGSHHPAASETAVPVGGVLQDETVSGVCPANWTLSLTDDGLECVFILNKPSRGARLTP